jgi:hypothetical protein
MSSRLAWIIAVVLAGTTIANACPPGPCLKYRHLQRPPLMPATAITYARALRANPTSHPNAIVALLTNSMWIPQDHTIAAPNMLPALPLRFVDPRQGKISPARGNERVVLVRRLDRRGGITMVEVDGQVFELARCRDTSRQWTSCLTLRTDLSFDVLDDGADESSDHHFAQPPSGLGYDGT